MKKKKLNNIQNKRIFIINSSKNIVIKNGWNESLFNEISSNKIISSRELNILFPRGYIDMLQLSLKDLNDQLEKRFYKIDIIKLPLHKRVKKVLIEKISLMNISKEFYKKTFYYLLLPINYKLLTSQIYKTVDLIWYIAKDRSTDFNYYSKRIILSAVYSSAVFHFFNNNNLLETERKLDQLLLRVSKIPKIKNNFKFINNNLTTFVKRFINNNC